MSRLLRHWPSNASLRPFSYPIQSENPDRPDTLATKKTDSTKTTTSAQPRRSTSLTKSLGRRLLSPALPAPPPPPPPPRPVQIFLDALPIITTTTTTTTTTSSASSKNHSPPEPTSYPTHAPPILIDLNDDPATTTAPTLDLAARQTIMYADELHHHHHHHSSPPPSWDDAALRALALTFLRPEAGWEVRYRCGVLPWKGWFALDAAFLHLVGEFYERSVECDDDDDDDDDGGGGGDADWVCFSRRRRDGVLRVDLSVRFDFVPPPLHSVDAVEEKEDLDVGG